jgi:hypothetical protein
MPLQYHVIFLLRRFMFAVICVLFSGYPSFQIISHLLTSFMVISYICNIQPFRNVFMNKLEMYNELSILIIAYHLFIFTDFVSDNLIQYKFGLSVIVVTVLNILVNMMFIVV